MTVMLDGAAARHRCSHSRLALSSSSPADRSLFAAVAGASRVRRALSLLKEEVDRDMALLGVRSIAEITPDLVRRPSLQTPYGRNAHNDDARDKIDKDRSNQRCVSSILADS